jgi:hypothetical protein
MQHNPSPPRACVVRVGCGCQSRAGLRVRREGTSYGRAKLDTEYEKDMVQPLDGVQEELC